MSTGEALGAARRGAGLTVTQVSGRTRIREAIITGIEHDDYSACGGDFYARGHIRAIARAVGTDPEPLIREYDAIRRGTPPIPATASPSAGPGGYRPSAGPGGYRPSAAPGGCNRAGRARRGARARSQLNQPAVLALALVALGLALVAGLGFLALHLLGRPAPGGRARGPVSPGGAPPGRPPHGTAVVSAVAVPSQRRLPGTLSRRGRSPRPVPGPSVPTAAAGATTPSARDSRSTALPPRRGTPTGTPPPASGTCIRAPGCS